MICLQFGFSCDAYAQGEGLVPDSIEYEALKTLYDSLDGPNWTSNTNWLQGNTSADFNTQSGITVTDGDVSNISLENRNLTGKVPAAIGNLTDRDRKPQQFRLL